MFLFFSGLVAGIFKTATHTKNSDVFRGTGSSTYINGRIHAGLRFSIPIMPKRVVYRQVLLLSDYFYMLLFISAQRLLTISIVVLPVFASDPASLRTADVDQEKMKYVVGRAH